MLTFFTILHILLALVMIFVILLQPGKDAGMGSALGGGAATSAFGGRGAVTFLSKVTGVCAALFFLTSLGLSFVGLRTSVAAGGAPAARTAPAQPQGTPVLEDAPAQPMGEQGAPETLTPSQPTPGTTPTPASGMPVNPETPGAKQ
jgi:preprotein translocase subunit SecG